MRGSGGERGRREWGGERQEGVRGREGGGERQGVRGSWRLVRTVQG